MKRAVGLAFLWSLMLDGNVSLAAPLSTACIGGRSDHAATGYEPQSEKAMSDPTNQGSDPIEIAKRTFQAYVDKDRQAIETLIADDFRFTSPLDNGIDRRAYFERCWPNSERISDFSFAYLAQAGDQVFVTVEGRGLNDRTFRNTEVLTIRNGKVVASEVYFGWDVPHELPHGKSKEVS
jgi:ketosteroid isomerase-like protein